MRAQDPLISVVMPVYNAERYLASAVESILTQTLGDFEFICVDDGSTDGSGRILRDYAQRDARLRVVSRPNTGLVGALNDGLHEARGRWIARMDADDQSLPKRFARQIEYLGAHPDCLVLGTRVVMTDPEGLEVGEDFLCTTHEQIEQFHRRTARSAICHPSVMMQAAAVRQAGGYRREYELSEDLDLWLRLSEVGRLANLAEPLLRYRMHEKSWSRMDSRRQLRHADAAWEQTWRRHGLAPPRRRRRWLVDYFGRHVRWRLAARAAVSGIAANARPLALKAWRHDPLAVGGWLLSPFIFTGRAGIAALRMLRRGSRQGD